MSAPTTARSSTSTLDRSVYTSHCRVFNLNTGQPAQCRRHVAGSGEDGEDSGGTWEACHDPACAATGLTDSHRGTALWNLQRMAPRRALSQSATATVAVRRSRPRNSSVKGRPTPDHGGKRRASTSRGQNGTVVIRRRHLVAECTYHAIDRSKRHGKQLKLLNPKFHK